MTRLELCLFFGRGARYRVAWARRRDGAGARASRHLRLVSSGTVLATVVLAGTLAGCGEPSNEATGLVPWLDQPSAVVPLRPLPVKPPPTNAPACRSAEISVIRSLATQYSLDDGILVELKNLGPTTCLLAGTPRVTASAPGDPTVVAKPEAMPNSSWEANTAPDATVWLEIDTFITCSVNPGGGTTGLPVYRAVSIELPGGGTKVVGGLSLTFPCGMSVTPFWVAKPQLRYPPDPFVRLVPRLKLPATVKAGTTLVYEVDLLNPGNRAVQLSPCPVYIEQSYLPTKDFFRLNCRRVHVIPAHGEVRYQMEMAIPAGAVPGHWRIWWSFPLPGDHDATGQFRVR